MTNAKCLCSTLHRFGATREVQPLDAQLGRRAHCGYVHESLTPEQALNRLVEHYKAWAVNRPGGRR